MIISIPKTEGLSKYQLQEHLNMINDEYDNCEINYSNDEFIHYQKDDTDEKIFLIIINLEDMNSRQQAETYVWKIMKKYEKFEKEDGLEIVWLPTQNEEDKIIKLTNTDYNLELLHV